MVKCDEDNDDSERRRSLQSAHTTDTISDRRQYNRPNATDFWINGWFRQLELPSAYNADDKQKRGGPRSSLLHQVTVSANFEDTLCENGDEIEKEFSMGYRDVPVKFIIYSYIRLGCQTDILGGNTFWKRPIWQVCRWISVYHVTNRISDLAPSVRMSLRRPIM